MAHKKIPIEKLTTIEGKDLVQIYKDYYWLVEDGCTIWNQGRNPLCNKNESICENIAKMFPSSKVLLIPVVYIPIKSNDFDYHINKLLE